MTKHVPSDKELLEILELAKVGEQKLKEAAEMATALAQKYQRWYEAKQGERSKLY